MKRAHGRKSTPAAGGSPRPTSTPAPAVGGPLEALPPAAPVHTIDPFTCVRCGGAAPGYLRVAVWDEEEKGRLSAKAAILCAACHDGFFSGLVSREQIARWYHEARGYDPAGWVSHVDRDLLLNVTCLECGSVLPLDPEEPIASEAAESRSGPRVAECPTCGAANTMRVRDGRWVMAEVEE